MLSVLKIFFQARGTRPVIVLACLLLAGFAEAIGLMTFLPLLSELTGGGHKASPLSRFVSKFLETIGLTPDVGTLLIVIVIAISIKALLSFAALSYVGYATASVAAGLRLRLLTHLLNSRWRYFTELPTGKIANVISNDATRAGSAYMFAGWFLALLLQTCVYIIVAFMISWRLAAAGLLIGGIIAFLLNFLVRVSRKAGLKQTNRTSEITTLLSDTLNNIKPLKAMNRQSLFSALFDAKIHHLKKSVFVQALSKQGLKYGGEIFLVVTVAIGIYLASSLWKIPVPELLITGLIFVQVISLVRKAQKYLQETVQLESAYWAVHNMIEQIRANREVRTGNKLPSLDIGCSFENVTFSYHEKNILNAISLDIPAHRITVLQGRSGSGKTTIADLVIGLFVPDSGQILIDGTPLSEIDMDKWRQRIGYVPQEPTLFHDTIRANITLGDETITEAMIWDVLEQAGMKDIVLAMPDGLETSVGERGTRISGGQKQRIALARALITRPDLLILDEVTSALDEPTERDICRNISKLTPGYTILAITHRPAWAEIAHRLYKIENGGAHLATFHANLQKDLTA
ncbi:MAG TPA: ABC transporter ATP-binding protein [Rhizobiales bacterium]|nr:ABC transporter ATP-binding protein [Hyphomicrobiales bacterium]